MSSLVVCLSIFCTLLFCHEDDIISLMTIEAFSIRTFPSRGQEAPRLVDVLSSTRHALSSTSLSAMIYGVDGKLVKEESYETLSSLDRGSVATTPLPLRLESLQARLNPSLLARIACAFVPPPHNTKLHPRDIESARIVSANAAQIDVALSVPDVTGERCAQILVHVPFPTPCASNDKDENGEEHGLSSLEECIVEKVKKLDSYALQRIAMTEAIDDNFEANASQARILQALQEEPAGDEFPDWWTFTDLKVTLADKCASLKKLLNEDDFATDLCTLCRMHYPSGNNAAPPAAAAADAILKARVASVGPSGLFLRAYVRPKIDDKDESNGNVRNTIVQVPIQFKKKCANADELQTIVVDLVESVNAAESSTAAMAAVAATASTSTAIGVIQRDSKHAASSDDQETEELFYVKPVELTKANDLVTANTVKREKKPGIVEIGPARHYLKSDFKEALRSLVARYEKKQNAVKIDTVSVSWICVKQETPIV